MVGLSRLSELVGGIKDKVSFKKSDKEGKEEKKDVVPPSLPETAKDMFDDGAPENKEKIEEPVAQDESKIEPAPSELPDLDFDDKKEEKHETKEEHRIIPKDSEISGDDEIKLFEDAVSSIYPEEEYHEELHEHHEPEPRHEIVEKKVPVDHGFFSEFQRFVEGNEINDIAEDLMSKDLLEKMKDYHRHKEEGKPYYFHSEELKQDLSTSLNELKHLEREWFIHKERLTKEEELMAEKEKQIEKSLEKVKFLLKNIKHREDFTNQVPEENYFKLKTGQALKSLSDLTTALRVMDDEVFDFHKKNDDFAEWVEEVFNNKELAFSMTKAKTKQQMLDVLTSFELQ